LVLDIAFGNPFKQILNQPLNTKSTPLAAMMVVSDHTLLDCIPGLVTDFN